MARELAFPRTRHVALSAIGQVEEAKSEGAEAILVPIRVAETAGQPAAGSRLPEPTQPGAPGVPEPGELPSATPAEGLAAGAAPVGVQAHVLPWTVEVDLSQPAGEVDRCMAMNGSV